MAAIEPDRLTDPIYRLDNLYHIVNRKGDDTKLSLTPVQRDVLEGLHTRNVILKARQLGMSTLSVLCLVDRCIWEPFTSAGIVSYSLEHAQYIFRRIIGHALDNLPPWLRVDTVSRSAREITFSNGSVLRVDTTLRGGSYQFVLVSEFGKTCARTPAKAEEIVTGTLQAVPSDGTIIIESTAEGNEGYFADIVRSAEQRGHDVPLSHLDYKLFFYPWYVEPSYSLPNRIEYDVQMLDYFRKIEADQNVVLSEPQRYWYVTQSKVLQDKIKQEFPSTIAEAFHASSGAHYFAEGVQRAYADSRCVNNSIYDPLQPVYVAMDIGVNDLTVMAFFQVVHGEIRIFDYYEDREKGVDFYARFLLQDKTYLYHTIFLPHDSVKRDPLDTSNSYERDFRRLFGGRQTKFHVLPRMDKQLLISHAKAKLERCVFNIGRVKRFVDMIEKYRKKWNEGTGRYIEEPYHNEASNYADTFQYVAQAVGHIEATIHLSGAHTKHREAVEARSRRII